MKNYYEILEVNQKASKEVIEKAYKVLVKKYHPDVQSDLEQLDNRQELEQRIKEINEAYEVLSNDFLREQYDIEIEKQEMKKRRIDYTEHLENKTTETNPKKQKKKEEVRKHKVGSFLGMIDLLKELYKERPKRKEKKEITKIDIIAIVLTIIVVILIGVALWFIPFTNQWMRELLFENPLFNWIGSWFSR